MFSQFRQAVESIAVQPRSSTDTPSDEQSSPPLSQPDNPPGSTSPLSSSLFAESAPSNLRKSFATNRAGPAMAKSASLPPTALRKPRQKLNLEERLRASLSTSDMTTASASPSNTAQPEAATSAEANSPSPASTPLPDSPFTPPVEFQDSTQSTPAQESDPEPQSHFTESDGEHAALAVRAESNEELGPDITANDAQSDIGEVQSASAHDVSDNRADEGTQALQDSNGHPPKPVSTLIDAQDKEDELSNAGAHSVGPQETDDIEALQRRLKQVEQRFSNVSTSFKRLQAEKIAADGVLRDLTPLESVQDAFALKKYFESLNSKTEVFQDEIKRLNGKLEVQEDRIEELRETHKLSASSQRSQIDTLQGQLRETEALFQEGQKSIIKLEDALSQKEKDIGRLKSDLERSNIVVKEEEEKRTKAISLLKSVRQKLVKAEKDKDDALKEVAALREKDRIDAEKEQAEKKRLEREIDAIHVDKEKSLTSLQSQFEREIASLKERHDKDMTAMRSQFELEAITTKSAHNREIASKNSHISILETSLNGAMRDKNAFFEQLQLRQAETESAQSHLESIQHQNSELQYQLREANDRVNLLSEDLNELQREQELRAREPSTSAENIAHLLASTESKYETKVAELKRINAMLERERNDSEAEWSRKLKGRGAEIEELKWLLGNSAKSQEKEEETVAGLKAELQQKDEEVEGLGHQLDELSKTCTDLENSHATSQAAANDLQTKIVALEKQIEESKIKDAQLRQTNKSLREELRKVQSSAALLERHRNPGVGYWTTRTSESSPSDTAATTPTPSSPRTVSPAPELSGAKNEEEVNLEYLRNIILQFLEHKEMRPNLVRVLSIILHFTPQETRRLMAKV